MDWLFNLQIPRSQPGALIIRPAGKSLIKTFITLAKLSSFLQDVHLSQELQINMTIVATMRSC